MTASEKELIQMMSEIQFQILKNQITLMAALSRVCTQVGSSLGEVALESAIDENTAFANNLTKKLNKLSGLDG